MAASPDIEFPDGAPKYTPEEERELTVRLLELTRRVHGGLEPFQAPTVGLLIDLHRRFFSGIREHAGRPRGPGSGSEHLVFGPNRSIHRNEVPGALEHLFVVVRASLETFDANPQAPDFEALAIHLAIWTHAEIVRIHPFEDGNGRTSRLIMAGLLVRLGLRPIPVEACKDEYTDALNKYFPKGERGERKGDIGPLKDLFLQLARRSEA